jgi:hypothetical protein
MIAYIFSSLFVTSSLDSDFASSSQPIIERKKTFHSCATTRTFSQTSHKMFSTPLLPQAFHHLPHNIIIHDPLARFQLIPFCPESFQARNSAFDYCSIMDRESGYECELVLEKFHAFECVD